MFVALVVVVTLTNSGIIKNGTANLPSGPLHPCLKRLLKKFRIVRVVLFVCPVVLPIVLFVRPVILPVVLFVCPVILPVVPFIGPSIVLPIGPSVLLIRPRIGVIPLLNARPIVLVVFRVFRRIRLIIGVIIELMVLPARLNMLPLGITILGVGVVALLLTSNMVVPRRIPMCLLSRLITG